MALMHSAVIIYDHWLIRASYVSFGLGPGPVDLIGFMYFFPPWSNWSVDNKIMTCIIWTKSW